MNPATVEINDAVFCQEHLQEVVCLIAHLDSGVYGHKWLYLCIFQCVDCEFDGREEKPASMGYV